MRLGLAAGMMTLLGLTLQPPRAAALQFEQVQLSSTEAIIGGRGPIVKGDTERLELALSAIPPSVRLVALAFDSPGGNVSEGVSLANVIRTHQLPVLIPSNSKCVSACFLLLASSPRRYAASDALIGVHSASENGAETDSSLAVTTLMARDAAELGIPSAIIGKMVQTTPGRVEWLDHDDLASMNVTVFDGDTQSAIHSTTATANIRPSVPAPPQAAPQASGFGAGRDDRRTWNLWFAGLAGAYRDGAVFAQSQMAAPQPASCYGPNGANRGDFTLGCIVALRRLMPIASALRTSADYATGWNSVADPPPAGISVEAEYHGVYFCGRQMARLTLKVLSQQGGPNRRAIFSFGPEAASPEVPKGAFIVEGSIDLNGGTLALTPVQWVSQPGGYPWLGLRGSSTDGGKTFRGPVTNSNACTNFTLERVAGPGTR
jgi:hypothetical protein